MFDLSNYMNKPECNVCIGDVCYRDDMLFCDTEYLVVDVVEKNNKFYAVCEYKDEFDGSSKTEEIYAFYLRRKSSGS